jgi:hypothetical protein
MNPLTATTDVTNTPTIVVVIRTMESGAFQANAPPTTHEELTQPNTTIWRRSIADAEG